MKIKIKGLEELEKDLENLGDEIEKAIRESGLEDIIPSHSHSRSSRKDEEKETIKKRVSGLINLEKSIPIEKLAHALKVDAQEAENIIYELAAARIEGTLDEGVFRFTSPVEEVINQLNEIIEKNY